MNDLTQPVTILSKPYTLTRSKIGAVTKVFKEKYICDPNSLRELFERVGEKLEQLKPIETEFSFLISYSDQTHHDGVIADLHNLKLIPTGKQTERVVLQWTANHLIDGEENETSLTLRISNPINPLVYLQAALSKSANDIDNIEFEMGSTCVTVNGAGQMYAEEVFHSIKQWIESRNKPHAFLSIHKLYGKYEWLIDELSPSFLPLLLLGASSLAAHKYLDLKTLVAVSPILFGLFVVARDYGRILNSKMVYWANKSKTFSMFLLTNGDSDALSKVAASSKNSCIKLGVSSFFSLLLNIAAGIICYILLRS